MEIVGDRFAGNNEQCSSAQNSALRSCPAMFCRSEMCVKFAITHRHVSDLKTQRDWVNVQYWMGVDLSGT